MSRVLLGLALSLAAISPLAACDFTRETKLTIVNSATEEAGFWFNESSDGIHVAPGKSLELPPIYLDRVVVYLGEWDATTPSVEHEFDNPGGSVTLVVHGPPVQIEVKD
jgi:hypothetical protein